jgi:flavin reductase (DIM6/NTAB) family NADH-FMN oxidoreductase RutF
MNAWAALINAMNRWRRRYSRWSAPRMSATTPGATGATSSSHRPLLAQRHPAAQPRTSVVDNDPPVGQHATTDLMGTEISAHEFRLAIGCFATGVTVVTSIGPDGKPAGTTANAVSSLSLNPALILVCFNQESLTLQAIRGHGAFAVNVLAEPQRHLSANFARRGPRGAWIGVPYRRGITDSPLLDGVLAALECTVEHHVLGGDHEIVIGRVRYVETDGSDAAPLLYWRGSYASLGKISV